MMNDQQHDGEIVGLHASTNGRSCNQHECCGRHLQPGQIIRLKTEAMEVVYETPGDPEPDARVETIIKAVLFLDGTELCTGESPPILTQASRSQDEASQLQEPEHLLEYPADEAPLDMESFDPTARPQWMVCDHGGELLLFFLFFMRALSSIVRSAGYSGSTRSASS
jgi:hypothetical protein